MKEVQYNEKYYILITVCLIQNGAETLLSTKQG